MSESKWVVEVDRTYCSVCGSEPIAPDFSDGVVGAYIVGCKCPMPEPPTRGERKHRNRISRAKLIECLELLRSILDDGKLRDEHAQRAVELGVWKP